METKFAVTALYCGTLRRLDMPGQPLQFLLLVFAGWVNRKQLEVIDYLKEENRILREQMQGRRLRLTDDERRRLAARGKVLDRKRLQEVTSLPTPDTILRWYRELIANKYNGSAKRGPGRPATAARLKRDVGKVRDGEPRVGLHAAPRCAS